MESLTKVCTLLQAPSLLSVIGLAVPEQPGGALSRMLDYSKQICTEM